MPGCDKLGIKSLGLNQAGYNSFLICGISNALDGSEDDHVSDDLLVIELDSGTMGEESEEDEAEDSDSDADELGDPFSDDSDTELD